MSIERLIATSPAGSILAGLSWRPPAGGKPSRAAFAEARGQADATHFVLLSHGSQSVYGLYAPRPSEEGGRLPKAVYSAAALFALAVGTTAPNAALVIALGGGEEGAGRRYLVVLEEGLPTIDLLGNEGDVLRALGSDDRPMWSDDPVAFPRSEPADLQWLVEQLGPSAKKPARVQRCPVNVWPAVIAVAVVVAAAGSWWAWQERQRAEQARLAQEQAAAADPVPRYLAALESQRATMMTRRDQLLATTQQIFALPAFVAGWQLRAVDCDVVEGCHASWVRRGGTFSDLKRALPAHTFVVDATAAGAAPNLDQARTRWAGPLGKAALDGQPPTYMAALSEGGGLMQSWRTAQIGVSLEAPTLWPTVPGLAPGFVHARAVKRGKVFANEIPGPMVAEAIRSAPSWVSWDSLHLDVADLAAGSARKQLLFKLNGTYYVAATN